MKKRFIQGLLTGVLAVMSSGVAIAFLVMRLGPVPVNADQQPSALEARLLGTAVHASIARKARNQSEPPPATDESLITGAEIYLQMCAKCHGRPNAGPSVYGASFYPPAPQLAVHSSQYTEAEVFWIIKHGIRNTGMLAWGKQLSDDDIRRVAAFLKRLDALPPAVTAEWENAYNRRGGP